MKATSKVVTNIELNDSIGPPVVHRLGRSEPSMFWLRPAPHINAVTVLVVVRRAAAIVFSRLLLRLDGLGQGLVTVVQLCWTGERVGLRA